MSRSTGGNGVRVEWLRRSSFLDAHPDLPTPGPGAPGVHVQPDYVELEDLESWRESGGRVCRRCGWGVPLMTAGDDELCPCGGQLL